MNDTHYSIADDAALDAAVERYALTTDDAALIVRGRLEYGLPRDGALHYDFAMHLATIGEDTAIDADLTGVPRLIAVFAAALDTIGTAAGAEIDADFLGAHLASSDFDALYYAQELLAKKRRGG